MNVRLLKFDRNGNYSYIIYRLLNDDGNYSPLLKEFIKESTVSITSHSCTEASLENIHDSFKV